MMDASQTAQFKECKEVLTELFPEEKRLHRLDLPPRFPLRHASPRSTAARRRRSSASRRYLLTEKHLHTFVKCNPTILGYKTARTILDSMGYDYIVFDEHHFNEDLQWEDAVPMFERLQALADSKGLEFGLKLSNTFPVDTTRDELPGDGNVHVRPQPVPADDRNVQPHFPPVWRQDAHFVRRRRGLLQL